MKLRIKLCLALSLLLAGEDSVLSKDDDQQLIVQFPSVYIQMPDGTYKQRHHFWLVEEDFDILKQKMVTDVAMPFFVRDGQEIGDAERRRILERIRWFALDPIDHATLTILLSDGESLLAKSDDHGHVKLTAPLDFPAEQEVTPNISIHLNDGAVYELGSNPLIIQNKGLSVISDIDDTLKVSNVISRKQMIKSTFIKPYEVMKGLPLLLQKYRELGANFHYVSASPWQIWPSLQPFLLAHYPRGQIHLRDFPTTLMDKDFYKFLFGSSVQHKTTTIEKILDEYPGHEFVLIGDTSECDPEIYGEIARKYRSRIREIILLKVPQTDFSSQRMQSALFGVESHKYQLLGEEIIPGIHKCKVN